MTKLRVSRQPLNLLASWVFLVAACGTGDDLSQGAVTNIPAGNAVGSSFSGNYEITRTTRACAGACLVAVGPLTIRFCRVGDMRERTATIAQVNGNLGLSISGESPSSYRGGIDTDGSFDVGAAEMTEYGTTTVRVEGTIQGRSIIASARSRVRGSYMSQTVDCMATYDVIGAP